VKEVNLFRIKDKFYFFFLEEAFFEVDFVSFESLDFILAALFL